jgi:hypothetical protein
MSYADSVLVYRDSPIIDGRVAVPPDYPIRCFELPDPATIVRLSLGSGHQTSSAFGAQEFVRLVDVNN